MRSLLLITFLLIYFSGASQHTPEIEKKLDSLRKIIRNSKHDSTIVNVWKEWDNIVYTENMEESIQLMKRMDSICSENLKKTKIKKEKYFFTKNKGYALNCLAMYYTDKGQYTAAMDDLNQSLKEYEKINYGEGISAVYINIGRIYLEKSDYKNSLIYSKKSLAIKRKLKDVNGIATACLNIGNAYYNMGDYVEAIRYTTYSLKEFEKLKSDIGIAYALNNIGLIYQEQGESEKAVNSYQKSLKLRKKVNDLFGVAGSYNNIGLVYQNDKNNEKALEYYLKCIEICKSLDEKQTYSTALNNIGLIHQQKGEDDEAIRYFEESLRMRIEIEDQLGISQSETNIANHYYKKGLIEKAISHAEAAYETANKWNLIIEKRNSAELLQQLYRETGRFAQALEMYDAYLSSRDSIEKEANQKEVIKQEFEYKYAKQTAADSVQSAERKKVTDAQIAQQEAEIQIQKSQQLLLFGGLGLVLVFSIFIFNRFRVTQRQNKIIEEQKHIVDEKNQEITDSIKYAKRIQTAILPPDKLIKSYLPNSFVLYLPKDIVAGDFYWLEESNENLLIAACDCTGHGVPGAMVSVVCNNGLNRSVREFGRNEPGKILDKTREIVIQEFEKSEEEVKDGMDISLISLKENELKWAGANNPLWIIRNGELIEYKADKQPIGKYADQKPFTTHTLTVQKNDSIYILTDGLQDQFGGEKGKKLKASKLKELLLSIQDKTMEQQKEKIHQEFLNWKGNLEQNDDVCIIGIRI